MPDKFHSTVLAKAAAGGMTMLHEGSQVCIQSSRQEGRHACWYGQGQVLPPALEPFQLPAGAAGFSVGISICLSECLLACLPVCMAVRSTVSSLGVIARD